MSDHGSSGPPKEEVPADAEPTGLQLVHGLADKEGVVEAPTDIAIGGSKTLALPGLTWKNHANPPAKLIITNTGHTVNVGGKWDSNRPFLRDGPFKGQYVFAQMHFHWGPSDVTGSEHTVDGVKLPMELHVVHINRVYRTQELALKENDGVAILIYLFQLQEEDNSDLTPIVEALPMVTLPQTSTTIEPMAIEKVILPFQKDYFLYWGSVSSATCKHRILWITCRTPLGISSTQLSQFRQIRDVSGQFMVKNFRETNPRKSYSLFHVKPSSKLGSTLLAPYPGHALAGDKRTFKLGSGAQADGEGSRRASGEAGGEQGSATKRPSRADLKPDSQQRPSGEGPESAGQRRPGASGHDDRLLKGEGFEGVAADDGYKSLEGTVLQESSHPDVLSLGHVESGVMAVDEDAGDADDADGTGASLECKGSHAESICMEDREELDRRLLSVDQGLTLGKVSEGGSSIRVEVEPPQDAVVLGEAPGSDDAAVATGAGETGGAQIHAAGPGAEEEAGTTAGAKAGLGGEVGVGAEAEAGAGVEAATGARAGAGAEAEVEAGAGVGAEVGARAGAEAEVEAGAGVGAEVGAKEGVGARAGAEAEVEAGAGLGAEVGANEGVGVRARAGEVAGVGAKAGGGSQAGVGAEAPLGQDAVVGGGLDGAPAGAVGVADSPSTAVVPPEAGGKDGEPGVAGGSSAEVGPGGGGTGVAAGAGPSAGARRSGAAHGGGKGSAGRNTAASGSVGTRGSKGGAMGGGQAAGRSSAAGVGAGPGQRDSRGGVITVAGGRKSAAAVNAGPGPRSSGGAVNGGTGAKAGGSAAPIKEADADVADRGMVDGTIDDPGSFPADANVIAWGSVSQVDADLDGAPVEWAAFAPNQGADLGGTPSAGAVAGGADGGAARHGGEQPGSVMAAAVGGGQDRALQGGVLQNSALQDGALQDDALQNGALQNGALPTSPLQDGALQGGALQDDALQNGARQDGALLEGACQDGALQDDGGRAGGGQDRSELDGGGQMGGGPQDGVQDGGAQESGGGQGGESRGGGGAGNEDRGQASEHGGGGGQEFEGGGFEGQGGDFGGGGAGGGGGGQDGDEGGDDHGWADATGEPDVEEEKPEEQEDEERKPPGSVSAMGAAGGGGAGGGGSGAPEAGTGSHKGSADGGECLSEKGSKSSKMSKRSKTGSASGEAWADAVAEDGVETVEQELGAAALSGEEATLGAGDEGEGEGAAVAGRGAAVDGRGGAVDGRGVGEEGVEVAAEAAGPDTAADPGTAGVEGTEGRLPPPPPPHQFLYFHPELEERRQRGPEPVFFNSIAVSAAVLHSKASLTETKPTTPCHGKALKIFEEERQIWLRQEADRQAAEAEALKYVELQEEEWNSIAAEVAQRKKEMRPKDAEVTGVGWPFDAFQSENSNVPLLSPIDVPLEVAVETHLRPLVFDGHFAQEIRTRISNTGDTLEVRLLNPELTPTLHGGPLHDEFIFDSMHFHWSNGSTPDCLGSVHKVAGQRFSMEVHLLHYRAAYRNKTEALKHQGGLCAVAFMLHLAGIEDPFFARLARELPKIEEPMSCTPLEHNALMCCAEAATPFDYVTYPGTLIGREDNLNVVWIVYPKPIGICCKNAMQFQKLRAATEFMPSSLLTTHEVSDRPVLKAVPP